MYSTESALNVWNRPQMYRELASNVRTLRPIGLYRARASDPQASLADFTADRTLLYSTLRTFEADFSKADR